MKVDKFIKITQSNMSVKVYSLKFNMFSRYDQSLLSSPRDQFSIFVTGFADLVKE